MFNIFHIIYIFLNIYIFLLVVVFIVIICSSHYNITENI